ncbi:MAG TPA: diguanylate cyclase [Burkholderiaceae bacterium]|jgi:diguanylate cyclase|nr:diguanylate cyclase [Burkholderiaceae bacterium]
MYPQSKEESSEMLRLALPLLARHGSGCQPPSYTVWYEYVQGANDALRRVLDARIANPDPLTPDETTALFRKYVVDRELALTDELQSRLLKALGALSTSADSSDVDAARFGQALEHGNHRLSTEPDVEGLKELIESLVAETRRMQVSNADLRRRLDESKRDLLDITSKVTVLRSEVLLDPLTRLLNRRGLEKAMDDMLMSDTGGLTGAALLMVDIDHFKRINDTHGHVLGDRVLRAVAQVIKGSIGPDGVACRYGGEEFAILMPATSLGHAQATANDFRLKISEGRIRRVDGQTVGGISVSVGIAMFDRGQSMDSWISRADEALYASKRSGRNRVTVSGDI